MQTISFTRCVLAFVFASWALAARTASGQPELQLVTFTNTWKYYVTNANGPEGAWNSTNYDDSSWLNGLPLFGADSNPTAPYPIPFNTPIDPPPSGGPATLYFRTRFDFPSNTFGVTLTASNLLDDGAVFYLNGSEVQRIRMPFGAVSYSSFATGGPNEGVFEVFSMSATNLRHGDNVLAVELHQINLTSSDGVFGMNLTAAIPTPIVIIEQPQSQTTSEGTPVTFAVTVTGSNPIYRWYKKPIPVIQGNSRTLTLNNPTLTSAGSFFVSISNALGVVTSQVAVLTVLKDVFPPGLRSAIAQDSGTSNTIVVTFTERLRTSLGATNPVNYIIRQVGTTNRVQVSQAQSSLNLDTVVLTVDPTNWVWGSNYLLTVSQVADLKTNYTSPQSNQIAIAFPHMFLGWNGTSLCWDDVGASLHDPPVELSTNWIRADLDDSGPLWFPVMGVAYADRDPTVALCANRGDAIDIADRVARCFRAHCTVPPNTGNAWIRVRYVIDDGAVFYLNGQEIHRVNMPPDQIYPYTAALQNVGPVCAVTTFLAENLRSGDNVLAVEVHNSSDSQDLDIYYGVEITAALLPDPIVIQPPRLTIVPAEENTVRLDWPADTGLDWTLETTTNLTSGPWAPVATSPPFQTDVVPGAAQFYRLRVPEPN